MEIAEHSVVGNLVVFDGGLYVVEHLVVSNDIAGVMSLECVDGDIHVVGNVDLVFFGVISLLIDVDEGFLVKHHVQFVPGSEHVDWMIEILVFDIWM